MPVPQLAIFEVGKGAVAVAFGNDATDVNLLEELQPMEVGLLHITKFKKKSSNALKKHIDLVHSTNSDKGKFLCIKTY